MADQMTETEQKPSRIPRRSFFGLAAKGAAALALATAGIHLASQPAEGESNSNTILSHQQFLDQIREKSRQWGWETYMQNGKNILIDTARKCVNAKRDWIIPSQAYPNYFFARDSFWALVTLQDRQLLEMTQQRFHTDQKNNPDGHIATALLIDGSKPEKRDRDEESPLFDIIREYELMRQGGTPDKNSLALTLNFILKDHIRNGRYVTLGEQRPGDDTNCYHYWADSYRPGSKAEPSPQVIAYNQGLLCVALQALEKMGIQFDPNLKTQAEATYANLTNPQDNTSLPQKEGSDVVDVSSLVGEALSLYYFNKPLLTNERVQTTLNRFSKVFYPDGNFLGFQVITSFDGSLRPIEEYTAQATNADGNYQRGGSWMLFDELALYAGARHKVAEASGLFLQRITSEFRKVASSHEFLNTAGSDPGSSEPTRDNYGWNSFIYRLAT